MRVTKRVREIARRVVPGIHEESDFGVYCHVAFGSVAEKYSYDWVVFQFYVRELDRRNRNG